MYIKCVLNIKESMKPKEKNSKSKLFKMSLSPK